MDALLERCQLKLSETCTDLLEVMLELLRETLYMGTSSVLMNDCSDLRAFSSATVSSDSMGYVQWNAINKGQWTFSSIGIASVISCCLSD